MTSFRNQKNECGPVIACGAACVSFDHEPGEPTGIDNLASAIKRFFKSEPAQQGFSSYEVFAEHHAPAYRKRTV